MGRRRPWVLGAQLGLTLSFLALALVGQPDEQMGLLMLVGVLINSFAATQDVAVDGMAIDVTPVNEQGRLNGFMVFGKAVGWGLTSAITGTMLVKFGLGVTAMAAAVVQAIVLLGFMMTRERRGERRLIRPTQTGSRDRANDGGSKHNRAGHGGTAPALIAPVLTHAAAHRSAHRSPRSPPSPAA